ncbi:MAG: kinase/pyrophosphorylase [Phyllobacteriaceae bacterium]|nr:kinase/pyrophosphorylase [Phyllobacteriaceae bacterium]
MGTKRSARKAAQSPIYILSGGTGASGRQIVETALAQFPAYRGQVVVRGRVRTPEQADAVASEAEADGGLVVHTLVDGALRESFLDLAGKRGVVEKTRQHRLDAFAFGGEGFEKRRRRGRHGGTPGERRGGKRPSAIPFRRPLQADSPRRRPPRPSSLGQDAKKRRFPLVKRSRLLYKPADPPKPRPFGRPTGPEGIPVPVREFRVA